MEVLLAQETRQVAGGVRVLQEMGNSLAIGAGATLLLGPEAIPLTMTLGLGAAAFLIVDSFVD